MNTPTNTTNGVLIMRKNTDGFSTNDSNQHKLSLLKQIKVTIESLMFGGNGPGNSSIKFNGITIIFCRQIMGILEDGLMNSSLVSTILATSPPSSFFNNQTSNQFKSPPVASSQSSLDSSSSPEQQSLASVSRKTTQTSYGSRTSSQSQAEPLANFPVLWSFIQIALGENKNFQNIYNQMIQQQKLMNGGNNSSEDYIMNNNGSQFLLFSSNNNNNGNNLVLEWIGSSLRQHCLLEQLTSLVSEQSFLKQFYALDSFILDHSFTQDFLLYIRSYEQKDFTILNKIKRNFFQPPPLPPHQNNNSAGALPHSLTTASNMQLQEQKIIEQQYKRRHQKQYSADLTSIMKQQHLNLSMQQENNVRNSMIELNGQEQIQVI